MAESGTTSSESELESALKITHRKTKLCLICEKSFGFLMQGSDQTFKTFKAAVKVREVATGHSNSKLNELVKAIEKGQTESFVWHKNCYSSFTSKKNLQLIQRRANELEHEGALSDQEAALLTRTLRTGDFEIQKCIFCQKRSNVMKLSQVLTTNIEKKIKLIAKENSTLLKRIGSNDLIAMEVKYHPRCFVTTWSKTRNTAPIPSTSTQDPHPQTQQEHIAMNTLFEEMEKGFAKKKGFSATAIYHRYVELKGATSKRQLIKRVKNYFGDCIDIVQSKKANEPDIITPADVTKDEILLTYLEKTLDSNAIPLFSGSSDYSVLHKIISNIKQEMDKIPTFCNFQEMDISSFKQHIPETLIWLITLLISQEAETAKEVVVLSLCQDIIFAYSKGKMTPKHVGLGVMVHQQTKSKKLVEVLHQCHSISYRDVLRVRNSIAQEEVRKYLRNDSTFIPTQVVPQRLLQFAADNIDILEETLDKSPTFHATQMVAFQPGPPNIEREHETYTLMPYKAQLDIPQNFHQLRRLVGNMAQKPKPAITNKMNIFSEKTNELFMRWHNMAWVLSRLSNSSLKDIIVPQWSGFHKIMITPDSAVTSYGHLPLLPYVASNYDTLWTVLTRCRSIAHFLQVKHVVVTFDQALYCKAKEIVWLMKDECSEFIIRMGGFHIMLNFLKIIEQYMENFGLKDVWIESGLYGEATIAGILGGKKWNKGIRAHKLTYECLIRILIPLFEKWLINTETEEIHTFNLAKLTAMGLCEKLQNDEKFEEEFNTITTLLNNCTDSFNEFIDSGSPTFKYWMTYLQLVEILLQFLFSERSRNWHLHLQSIRRMLPWFFTLDHTNYARWASVYAIDMLNLPTDVPEVYEDFCKGNFVIKRLPGSFNALSVDQALEHINKTSKDAGGIVGLTKNSTRLDEWFISFNEIGLMVDKFVNSLGIKTDEYSQNIETGPRRKVVDENAVLALHEQLCQYKVFSHTEENLLCISTNIIFNKNTENSLLNAVKIGEDALRKFIEIIDTDDFYKPLKKLQIMKMGGSKPTLQEKGKIKLQMRGHEIVQRVLAAREMGRQIDYQEIFKYELTTYPMSLTSNETLSTPSNKSALGEILRENIKGISNSFETTNNERLCHIFDGMSIVQKLGKPTNTKTFGAYADLFSNIILRNKYKAHRIDLVMDHYNDVSIKNCTRMKRAGSVASIDRIIDSNDIALPQQWHLFINSVFNKKQLTNFLCHHAVKHSKNKQVEFVTSGGFFDIQYYETNYNFQDSLLVSNHEEADTRILLHILSAKNAGYNKCLIECSDTDVILPHAHFKEHLTPEIWMKVGTRNNERFIPVHEIDLHPHLLKNLPSFHALTGCDTTSQFSGFGKKTCWKIYLTAHKLLDDLGVNLSQSSFRNIEKFVLQVYGSSQDVTSINKLRGLLAASKTLDKLPPTEDSLYQHYLRCHYQSYIWLNSLEPIMDLPNFVDYGWQLKDSIVVPVLKTLSSYPETIPFLTTCGCKKDCRSKTCSCRKNKISCIGSCRCMGQKSCKNKTTLPDIPPVTILPEDSGSDSE